MRFRLPVSRLLIINTLCCLNAAMGADVAWWLWRYRAALWYGITDLFFMWEHYVR